MIEVFIFAVFILVVLFLLWLFAGSQNKTFLSPENTGQVFDAADPAQVGFLIGMTGGSITDAAVARHALLKFEKTHGRKASARDIATVIGLAQSS